MPNDCQKPSAELSRLIEAHERDKTKRHEYSHVINPAQPVLFKELTVHQRAAFTLSLFMKRKDIALAMKIRPRTVTNHVSDALKRLEPPERKRYEQLRKIKRRYLDDWLVSSSARPGA